MRYLKLQTLVWQYSRFIVILSNPIIYGISRLQDTLPSIQVEQHLFLDCINDVFNFMMCSIFIVHHNHVKLID